MDAEERWFFHVGYESYAPCHEGILLQIKDTKLLIEHPRKFVGTV